MTGLATRTGVTTGETSSASGPTALWRCGGQQHGAGKCQPDDELLHRHARGRGPRHAPPIVDEVLATSGNEMPAPVRRHMESRLGHSFADVRVHTGERAADAARAVEATAFTVGRHIVLGSHALPPSGPRGRRLLAHELTHVMQAGAAPVPKGPLRVSSPDDPLERAAEQASAGMYPGGRPVGSGPPEGQLYRLGTNPGCTDAEADDIHQAIYDARGWLGKAINAMGESPLSERTVRSLRRNFGPTYGVEANADLIRNRLLRGRSALGTMPISCAGPEDAICAGGACGWANVGSDASTICRNVTLGAATSEVFQAGCVLHESFHATFSRFTVDSYSGWHGHSSSTAGYPGAGVDPLLNADSYTTLVMDLS